IADLAHIAMAIERLSLLAAIVLEDEQRWDGQERSTRYQDFSHPDHYTPDSLRACTSHVGHVGEPCEFCGCPHPAMSDLYRDSIDFLFTEYRFFSEQMFQYLVERTPRPADMKPDAYERTLRARAFDIARYLLPLATNTSLGQIVNARTLENQVSRLLSHTHAEVRALGEKLKDAAKNPAYNVHAPEVSRIVAEVADKQPDLARRLQAVLLKDVCTAPTLVKYADPNAYFTETREELQQAARELMNGAQVEHAPEVDLLDDEPAEIEIATTLLYEHCRYPYRQLHGAVEALGENRRNEIIALGAKHRGKHDELLRAYCAGQKFRFDILMDVGAFRDLHRHRRCVQIHQGFTFAHGFDMPREIADSGNQARYAEAMQRAREAAGQMSSVLNTNVTDPHLPRTGRYGAPTGSECPEAQYLLPLAYRKRTLFKMDFAEVVYISELRTTPAGHFSYRNIAYQMYEAVARRHPALAEYFRVCDVREPVDLLKR
ncbi:MAG TPA: FAD-dependent thymidylate synthase, partial [Terriglobales bacterium]|nr:FAD-dependent thymidylate synthase [Terriglobales bacterium]